ncbi:MAG: 50S ribosomal protein L29 [Pseudomonadota bacterium]
MKAGEIRQLSDDELAMKVRNGEEDLFRLRFQKHTGQLSNTSQLRVTKKDIARLRTEVHARELAAAAKKESSDE